MRILTQKLETKSIPLSAQNVNGVFVPVSAKYFLGGLLFFMEMKWFPEICLTIYSHRVIMDENLPEVWMKCLNLFSFVTKTIKNINLHKKVNVYFSHTREVDS